VDDPALDEDELADELHDGFGEVLVDADELGADELLGAELVDFELVDAEDDGALVEDENDEPCVELLLPADEERGDELDDALRGRLDADVDVLSVAGSTGISAGVPVA
jgi:phage-related baseplate assembly protein